LLRSLLQDGVDAVFVDGAHRRSRYAEGNPRVFFWHKEALLLQIRVELALSLVVGVGNRVPYAGTFASKVADAGHIAKYLGVRSSGSAVF
jgi:hypothetical protein